MSYTAKKVRFVNDHIYIEKKGDLYLPYMDRDHLDRKVPSKAFFRFYNQDKLKVAYETGELKSLYNSKGE